ncbi:alpha/beta fold hydrolase [Kitasatospora sp. NPDC048365]|uniref:alpha/beta fold hydrolase n=1 Tax=Kitasatospora sp. NPDC048365 TaxID=3364050 RepID=UPI003724612D
MDVPTSVLYGTRDRMTPPPHAHRLHAALPRPERLIELPSIGHMSPVESPDAVAAEIRRLVADHLTAPHRPTAAAPTRKRPEQGRAAR